MNLIYNDYTHKYSLDENNKITLQNLFGGKYLILQPVTKEHTSGPKWVDVIITQSQQIQCSEYVRSACVYMKCSDPLYIEISRIAGCVLCQQRGVMSWKLQTKPRDVLCCSFNLPGSSVKKSCGYKLQVSVSSHSGASHFFKQNTEVESHHSRCIPKKLSIVNLFLFIRAFKSLTNK